MLLCHRMQLLPWLCVRWSELKCRLMPTTPSPKKSAVLGNNLSLCLSCWKCTSIINHNLNLRLLDSSLVATSHIATSALLLLPPLTLEAHSVLVNNAWASVLNTSMASQPAYSNTTCLALKPSTNVSVILPRPFTTLPFVPFACFHNKM